MVHSSLILEHDNMSSNLAWYFYHGLKVSGSSHGLGFKTWRQVNISDALKIVKEYVQ